MIPELSQKEREFCETLIEICSELDERTGDGWSAKVDARQRGFSLHVRFNEKADVETALSLSNLFQQAPCYAATLCERLLGNRGDLFSDPEVAHEDVPAI